MAKANDTGRDVAPQEGALQEALHRLRNELAVTRGARRRFLVGAAIGTGMAAQSATRGGADFLLALSAGRMRCIGEPSIAAMLPLRDSNEFVMSFAPTEILPRATVPVFFGAASFDPRLDLDALIERIAASGFGGVANFPTAVLIDGAYRSLLEQSGVGFKRELDLLRRAKTRGLATLAYIQNEAEAAEAASAGIEMVNIDLGWNVGGVLGASSDLKIEEAALIANRIAQRVRTISPGTRCVVEGGPIVSPRQLEEFCQIAEVDGYIGGSTIDRVPSEAAIEVVTAAFKAIGVLRQTVKGMEHDRSKRRFPLALWGHSRAAEDARAMFAHLTGTDHPIVLVGEPGSGRRDVARALHNAGPRKARDLVAIQCANQPAERLQLDLFGCMAGAHPTISKTRLGWLEIAHGSSLMLDDVDTLPREIQSLIIEAVESGRFWRMGGDSSILLNVRCLGISGRDLRSSTDHEVDRRFAEWLGCFTITLPPLRERLEDLPTLIEEALRAIERRHSSLRKSLDASAFRILADHPWPGNLRELTAVLEHAVLAASGDVITEDHLPQLSAHRVSIGSFKSEMDWILHGLRENRFRKGRAAAYLGISRKTLYNKMRAYGLLAAGGER
ncbi:MULTISPECIES: phosphoenolpyruvate hydrolase family protein [unclassified Chelatococcus]|uniref:phosphoenolpyruvate hydrolase family protein n=1 Tax=unclassified Chelatococcus TaxID=2638111 RepID=UPI001BCEFC25|nr:MULTISPECIES: phosphoenolpyruvate hydrolase family protein [unclassified Chelatococcus]MBS7700667.1 phosphoenolpyruvate hydrolase family protein [Chelatococcus sp. YT9]MBX3559098.1 phosphoenolpyruvate hydrolase family protein [Chelatococcus sp.]